jgi:hypothetical protein
MLLRRVPGECVSISSAIYITHSSLYLGWAFFPNKNPSINPFCNKTKIASTHTNNSLWFFHCIILFDWNFFFFHLFSSSSALGWVGVAQRCLKIVDSRLHTRNAHFQPRKNKSRKWGKIKNPLGSGDTGRQRNVQLYIQTTACDRAPGFRNKQKGNIYTHTSWNMTSCISDFQSIWNAYEWNTKMTNWLGGSRELQRVISRKKKRNGTIGKKENTRGGFQESRSCFVQEEEEGGRRVLVQLHTRAWQIVLSAVHPR